MISVARSSRDERVAIRQTRVNSTTESSGGQYECPSSHDVEYVKRAPYSVVLLDEIEKAHPDVFNILLQVFEDGQLADGLGNTVEFKNAIIIMTSNIGARYLQKREGLGFQSQKEEMVSEKVEDLVKNEVKRTFNPEFLNLGLKGSPRGWRARN